MRVLHVLAPGAHIGGLERVVATLARGQSSAGVDVHVAVVDHGEPVVSLGLTDKDSLVRHSIRVPSRAYLAERQALDALGRRVRPDVIHTHGYRPDLIHGPVAHRLGLPVVSTVHGFTGGGARNVFYAWLQCRALRTFDAVAAVSVPIRTRLLRAGVPSHRVHVIPNACEPPPLLGREPARALLGLPPDGFTVGWVGRLSPEKGAEILVSALARLGDLPVHVTVLGDGSERPRLQALARALNLERRIRWCGEVADAARYLAAFDALALSSHREGSPMVILEAMAAGVPIVATDVGGVAHMVGVDGAYLVPAGDAEQFAAGLRQVHGDRARAQDRARLARARFSQRFRVAPWVAQYAGLYRATCVRAVA